ncbi:uncharacterized protein [Clytia hemisphaerica]|uniref:C2H2-type domain-containing protein n=1 Tax=Clytia hemisphaerica TaxID=252671 RepID=A0A7M5TR83_9CNID
MPKSGKYKLGGPVIDRSKQSGTCRVKDCKYYHKFLKNLKGHIERTHSLTLAEHKKLPPSLLGIAIKQNEGKDYMRYRVAEPCQIEGCKKFMKPFNDLTRHLRISHDLTRKEYNEKRKLSMAKDVIINENMNASITGMPSETNNQDLTAVDSENQSDPDSDKESLDSDERSVLDSDVPPSSPFNPEEYIFFR